MGYYSGGGVVISRRSNPVCIGMISVPSYYLDGQPVGEHYVLISGVTTETVTRAAGVEDPANSMPAGTITMYPPDPANNIPAFEHSSVSYAASRIGDSNLFEFITTSRSTSILNS